MQAGLLVCDITGGVGVIVANNQPGLIPMGPDPAFPGVTIPAFMITQAAGNTLTPADVHNVAVIDRDIDFDRAVPVLANDLRV